MREVLQQILELARWAPSGDNTQPWRFEIVADDHIAVHGFDTRQHVLYDFAGHASHLAHGALLETMRLAATRFGLHAAWSIRPGGADTAPVYDVRLTAAAVAEDPLVRHIEARTVQRRAMRLKPIDEQGLKALRLAVGARFHLQFFASFAERLAMARMLWLNAGIRLTCPEAYPVHRDVIEWGARYSIDRIPEQAVGVDALTGALMRWVMRSWERVRFFNRFLGGTLLPRLQLDFLPALCCAGHVLLRPATPLRELNDYLEAGAALQRLWLTATALGLQVQPEMTPVIFRWYVRAGQRFSASDNIAAQAHHLTERFEQLADAAPADAFAFLCRFGYAHAPRSRSLRQPLDFLSRP